MEIQKTSKGQSNLEKKNRTGGINCLISVSTTKPQSSRQCGTVTKTEI